MKTALLRYQGALLLAVAMLCARSTVAQQASAVAKECSKANVHGIFGYSSTGTLLDSYVPAPYAGPFGEVGRQAFDGRGNTSGTATTSSNGNIAPVTFAGTYTVNADCTGSMTLNVSPFESTVHAAFVIDEEGVELRAIGTDSGLIETRVYRKQ
jgi:hypothetical protein